MDFGTALVTLGAAILGSVTTGVLLLYANKQQAIEQERRNDTANKRQVEIIKMQFEEQQKMENVAHARQMATIQRDRLMRRYEALIIAEMKFYRDAVTLGRWGEESIDFNNAKLSFEEFQTTNSLLLIESGQESITNLCTKLDNIFADFTERWLEDKNTKFPEQEFLKTYNKLNNELRRAMETIEAN